MLKQGVSVPSILMKCVLQGTYTAADEYSLFAPGPEAYALLKEAVVGGLSLVVTRKHEVDKTRIRSHQYEDVRVVASMQGYDANSLYPWAMMQEMPMERERVTRYVSPGRAVGSFL